MPLKKMGSCIALIFCMTVGLMAIAQPINKETRSTNPQEPTMQTQKHILVVYFSRTGHTKTVAEAMASQLNADCEVVVDTKKRTGFWGALVGGKDAALKKETVIEKPIKSVSAYDLIIIGTPVWAANMTPAIRTYIKENKNQIKSAAFLACSGGKTPQTVFRTLETALGQKPIATIGVSEKDLKPENKVAFDEKLAAFCHLL